MSTEINSVDRFVEYKAAYRDFIIGILTVSGAIGGITHQLFQIANSGDHYLQHGVAIGGLGLVGLCGGILTRGGYLDMNEISEASKISTKNV